MPTSSRKRKLACAAGFFLLALAILLAAMPLWLPLVLQPVVKKYGVNYSGYERGGYNRFVLKNVTFTNANAKFFARRVESFLPLAFLWKNFYGDQSADYVQVSDWRLDFSAKEKQKTNETSVYSASKKIDPIFVQLNHWLPKAVLTNGIIHFGKKEIAVRSARWRAGQLDGSVAMGKLLPETEFTADLEKSSLEKISFHIADWNLDGEFNIQREHDSLPINGNVNWNSNRVEVSAQFSPHGILPQSASIEAKSFHIPASQLRMDGYRDLTGTLKIDWQTNQFAIDLMANAQPITNGETFLSPVEAVLRAKGDTNSVRIENATVSSPWMHANLSDAVEINFRGEMLSEAATLDLKADLSQQNWLAAKGQLNGQAELRRGENRYPDVTFSLNGSGVEVQKIETSEVAVRGNFEWPSLQIKSADIQFKGGGTASAHLRFNAVDRVITGGTLKLNGQIARAFFPSNVSYQNVALTAEVSGPLKKLSHSGDLELRELILPNLSPLSLSTHWQGTEFQIENFETKISATNATLTLAGALNVKTNQLFADIKKLVLSTNGQPTLTLEKPLSISASLQNLKQKLSVQPFVWRGEKTSLALGGDVEWPDHGTVSATSTQLDLSVFQAFTPLELPKALFEQINFNANWSNGPVNFSADSAARFSTEDGTPFVAALKVSGDQKGVSIAEAQVASDSETVISGKGFLPLRIEPANTSNLVQTLPDQKIDFHAATTPNSPFWKRVGKLTRANLDEPSVAIDLGGTVESPTGKVLLQAKEISLQTKDTNQPLPRLQNLSADFDLARKRIALHHFEVLVEGQSVTASGDLPLPKNLRKNWRSIFDWRKANGELKIVDAQIAPFQRLFPKFLPPLGSINVDLTSKNGRLDGELRVSDAALRPIPALGPVHDIDARLEIHGDEVTLDNFQGVIGGQSLDVSGHANLGKVDSRTHLPQFSFKVFGTNVPLVRRPELILRSDVDLNISNEKGGDPVISGTLNLRDSFYLSDLKLLLPGKVARPRQRPPYFSIETEPFSHWRLDLDVTGENAFKVRNPIFRGDLSANLQLNGTLREPSVIGDARVNSGVVQFPFANLRVDQGDISLTSENPYRPQISLTASARTFSYDVKMEVSGPADKPAVQFSSNPGLTSEQILLMITAGELPHDEINFSTSQKAGRLAFFLGKNLFSKLGSNGATADKLEIRSGDEVSEQGRQTYYLEYKLTDDWSLVGEYDRFGAVNAGVKWKFYSK